MIKVDRVDGEFAHDLTTGQAHREQTQKFMDHAPPPPPNATTATFEAVGKALQEAYTVGTLLQNYSTPNALSMPRI